MEVRQKLLARGIQLEVISMAWMAIEFVLGVSAGIHAGSILLIAFGLDAFLGNSRWWHFNLALVC
ncbi:MAG: hypothetical protein ACLT1C_04755 [Weissella confusa]